MSFRTGLIWASLVCLACPAANASDCRDLAQAQALNSTFEADDAAKQAALNKHTADRLYKIDAEAKALISAGVWTETDRKAYFGKARATAAYSKLEQSKKEPLFSVQIGRSTAPGIKAANPTGACSYAQDTLNAYDKLQAITDTQYDMLESGIAAVARDKGVSLPP
ncbi:MAG: hypothetical protein JWQ90_609 [Hydrocarboniphaga sp.]|uniref:hypothetical protein n=1 Tax=Hydrocarboniphaga sp. TaxID=2033016 RepID=UPI00261001D4|nr:hypothetical protein [Hydrocarboniphaga sp.]MDB5968159.1 hypothetical protein [Hydrocarboniphaga sp.]